MNLPSLSRESALTPLPNTTLLAISLAVSFLLFATLGSATLAKVTFAASGLALLLIYPEFALAALSRNR